MAVQAQYPSNVLLLNRNVQEGKNLLGNSNDYSLQPQPGGGGGFVDQSHIMLFNNNGVSGGGVNPRKRSREVAPTPTTTTVANTNNNNMNSFSFSIQNHHQQQHQQNPNQSHQLIDLSQLQNHSQYQQPNVVSTGLRLSFGDQNQQHHLQQQQIQQQQQQTSLLSLVSEEFALQLKQQNDELNYFLHAQGEQLRRTLAEKRQRHYRALIGAAEEAVARRVREKEAEVEKAARRNAELEARAAQLSAEAQAWQAKARAQEAQAASLQAQIHQAMVAGPVEDREGVTGSGGGGEAEDSESAYVDPVVSERRVLRPSCKVCRTRSASVVLFPCRHLCVCVECDNGVVSACPVCLSIRSASVEVFLS